MLTRLPPCLRDLRCCTYRQKAIEARYRGSVGEYRKWSHVLTVARLVVILGRTHMHNPWTNWVRTRYIERWFIADERASRRSSRVG